MFAVPLLGQFLLVDAINVKPLSLAVCVLAHHHLPVRGATAVTVPRLVGVVLPLAPLQALSHWFLPSPFLARVVVGPVEAALLQLLLQFFSGFVDERVELLRQGHFFFGVGVDLVFEGGDAAVFSLGLRLDFGGPFVGPAVQVGQEGLSSGVEVESKLFYFPVEGAYLSKELVGLRGDHVEAVYKVVHVAHPPESHAMITIFKFPKPHQSQFIPLLSVCAPHFRPPTLPPLRTLAHLLCNFKNKRMRKYSQDMQMLTDLETDHLDIAKLREQRQLVARVQAALLKKDQEIEQLQALLQKYQQYQQKYTSLKVELTERQHLISKKESECKMLRKQMEDLLREQAQNYAKIKQYENQRQANARERHQTQNAHKEIEATFKEYQTQYRKRENQLAFDLQRAYQQVKDAHNRIDQLELVAEEKRVLEEKVKQMERGRKQERQRTPARRESSGKHKTEPQTQSLLQEIDRLKGELLAKEQELTANRCLNYELTLQYDSSINGICSLQTELTNYRRENNQLKKILSLLREQEKCREIQQKYTLRNHTQMGTPHSSQNESIEEDDLPTHKFHTNDALTIQT